MVSSKPSEEKKALLNFAMKVGVEILYAMIEAIRKHSPKLALGINEIGQASVELRKGIEKDRLAEIWVKNALNPLVIFREFVKLPVIKRGLAIPRQIPQYKNKELVKEIHKSRSNPFVPDNPTLFELDEENFKQIIGAFADLWPITYKGFEDIKNRLPRSVDSTFETRDELEKMDSEKNITEKLKNVIQLKNQEGLFPNLLKCFSIQPISHIQKSF